MMQFFIHFYYGDLKEATFTAVGTVIRAMGQRKRSYIFYHSTSILSQIIKELEHYGGQLILYDDLNIQMLSDITLQVSSQLILIINVDKMLEDGKITLTELLELINKLKDKNEVIISNTKGIPEIIEIADYVSNFLMK